MAIRSDSVIIKIGDDNSSSGLGVSSSSVTQNNDHLEVENPPPMTRGYSLAVRNRSRRKSIEHYLHTDRKRKQTSEAPIETRQRITWWTTLKRKSMLYYNKRREKSKHRNVFQSAVYTVMNSGIYKFLLTVTVLLHATIMSLYQPETRYDFNHFNNLIYYFTAVFMVIYCLEAVLNMMAYGLILRPKHAFLRQPLFVLDLLVILFGALYLLLRFRLPVLAEVCSSLMALKLIRIFAFSQTVQSILNSLARSFFPLYNLFLLFAIILVFFALIGIELFMGRLHGGCYSNYTTPAGNTRSVLVSQFPCHLPFNRNSNLSLFVVGSHVCPPNSVCQEWDLGPLFGIVSFDDIFRGLVVVFQLITLEGWSAVYFLYESSLGYAFCWIYFLVVTQLGSVFILNLLTGVLTNVFKGFSARSITEEKTRKRLEEHQLEEENKGAQIRQKQIEKRKSNIRSSIRRFFSVLDSNHYSFLIFWGRMMYPECLKKFHEKIHKAVKSPIWLWFNITAHFFNLLLLMIIHFPSSAIFNQTINIINSIFSVYYVIEVFIRFYGIGPVRFFRHTDLYQTLANYAEMILAVLSIVFFVLIYTIEVLDEQFNLLVILNAVWSLKIVLACKPFKKSWQHLREILNTLRKLMKAILGLSALVGVFLFIYTNTGLRIFGTKLHLTNNNFQPNFDDFANSFFLVFQLLTTEDWHNTLYSSTGSIIFNEGSVVGIISSLYFMIGLMIGFFVLVTVFLALAVDELSEVESSDSDNEEESEEKTSVGDMSDIRKEAPTVLNIPKDGKNSSTSITEKYQRSKSVPDLDPPPEVVMSKSIVNYISKRAIKRNRSEMAKMDGGSTIEDSVHPTISHSRDVSLSDEASTPDFQGRYVRSSSLEDLPSKSNTRSESDFSENTSNRFGQKNIKAAVKMMLKKMHNYFGTIIWDPSKELEEIPQHSAFFVLNPNSRLRRVCFAIVKSQTFLTVTLAAIFLSSLLLTLEIPIGVLPSSQLCAFQKVSIFLDIAFVFFFVVEMILKMIALGVFVHKGSYFRGVFNFIDFIVTIFNLIPIIVYLMNWNMRHEDVCISYGYDPRALPGSIGALRVVRVFRPLRAFRIEGLYLVVTGMISSMKAMGSIFFFDVIVLIIFGVIGVHFFKGSFYFCSDPSIQIEEQCQGYFFNYDYTAPSNISNNTIPGLTCPALAERIWENKGLHFDNIVYAFVSLFVMLTSEGWQNVMYSGVNARRPLDSRTSLAAMLDSNRAGALYFILYMIFMTFILIQLLVGFVIVTFQQVGIKPFRETKLDRNQRSCLQFAITARPKVKWHPKNKTIRALQERFLPLVDSTMARAVVGLALVLNVFCLCLQTYQRDELNKAVYYINIGFTIFFAIESLTKMTILAPKVYFQNVWNACEFVIAAGSVLEFVLQSALPSPILPYSHFASNLRALIILRFLPEVRRILWTVIRSFKIFPWVAYLLFIIYFIYAVIGMHIFGTIHQGTVDESNDIGIHEYNNYGNFPAALLLIIRVGTGENWQDVMINSEAGQDCNTCTGLFQEGDTCGSNVAIPFYLSFYFISVIMVLNLFVAVIIDHFEYVTMDKSQLSDFDLKKFNNAWLEYDPQGTGMLTVDNVFLMLRNLEPPVGWGIHCPANIAYRKMMHLNIPVTEAVISTEKGVTEKVQTVTFNATLMALVRYALKIECGGCPMCQITCNLGFKEKLRKCFPEIKPDRYASILASEKDHTIPEVYAALLLQRHWMNLKKRRRQNALIKDSSIYLPPNPVGGVSPDVTSDQFARDRLQTMQVTMLQEQTNKLETSSGSSTTSSISDRGLHFLESPSPFVIQVQSPPIDDDIPVTDSIELSSSPYSKNVDRRLSLGIFTDHLPYDDDDESSPLADYSHSESQL